MLFPHGQCPKWGDSALVEIWPAKKSSSSELLLDDPWSSERGEKGGRSEFIQEQTINQVEFSPFLRCDLHLIYMCSSDRLDYTTLD